MFRVEGTARVHDQSAVARNEDAVVEAAEMCPVSVIEVTEKKDE